LNISLHCPENRKFSYRHRLGNPFLGHEVYFSSEQ